MKFRALDLIVIFFWAILTLNIFVNILLLLMFVENTPIKIIVNVVFLKHLNEFILLEYHSERVILSDDIVIDGRTMGKDISAY